jgi:hypothetical protein
MNWVRFSVCCLVLLAINAFAIANAIREKKFAHWCGVAAALIYAAAFLVGSFLCEKMAK